MIALWQTSLILLTMGLLFSAFSRIQCACNGAHLMNIESFKSVSVYLFDTGSLFYFFFSPLLLILVVCSSVIGIYWALLSEVI